MHGLEVRKPDNTIQAMISVVENIINDNSACYLLFLQDMFPYLEKYSVRDYMSKLADRISYLMEQAEERRKRQREEIKQKRIRQLRQIGRASCRERV